MKNKTVWFDITNTPQVHFLLSIMRGLEAQQNFEFKITARDFSETLKLLDQKTSLPYEVIGAHYGKNMFNKAIGLVKRYSQTFKKIGDFDVSISCGSESAVWSSFLKGKKSIAFGDNDLAKQWTYGRFVSHALFPKSIPTSILTKQGISNKRLYQYNGFKEHIYLADFVPNSDFLNTLPFDKFVVVRPENIQANYVQKDANSSITPGLLKILSESGINILYLPRYQHDKDFAKGLKNIFVPENAINGLDACYFSEGVFTGAGTFAREAACLGVPSFSFFAGEQLLAVDKDLVNQKKMFFSRNPSELYENFLISNKQPANLTKAKEVKEEVMSKLKEFMSK